MIVSAGSLSAPEDYDGDFIEFRMHDPNDHPGRKTMIWDVRSKRGGDFLGIVTWFPRWRKYAFFPEIQTLYEHVCLRDIAQFVEDRTREHKHGV